MNDAIRLTNKTAIALRRSAQRMRTAHYAAIAVLTLSAAVASFVIGVYWWPPIVALVLAVVAALDAIILVHSRNEYLKTIGQAICTEAAARDIRTGESETLRREKALSDLIAVKADAASAQKPAARKSGENPFFEKTEDDEDSDLYDSGMMEENDEDEDMLPPAASTSAPRRRRRQGNLQIIRSQKAE